MFRFMEVSELIIKRIMQVMVTVLFSIMAILVFAQVFTRFFTSYSLTWSDELSRFVMLWLIYSASILAYADNVHIMVDALIVFLKGRLSRMVQILSRLFVVLFACLVVAGAVKFLPTVTMQEAPATGLIMVWVYITIPISMIFTGLIAIRQICLIIATGKEVAAVQEGNA